MFGKFAQANESTKGRIAGTSTKNTMNRDSSNLKKKSPSKKQKMRTRLENEGTRLSMLGLYAYRVTVAKRFPELLIEQKLSGQLGITLSWLLNLHQK